MASVVLALNIIPIAAVDISGLALVLTAFVTGLFLASSLLALSVIWMNWRPTERTVRLRTTTYMVALVATASGIVTMPARIALGLAL